MRNGLAENAERLRNTDCSDLMDYLRSHRFHRYHRFLPRFYTVKIGSCSALKIKTKIEFKNDQKGFFQMMCLLLFEES